MVDSSKRKVVIWSGGADSTLVLGDLLEEASIKNPILVISVNHFDIDKLKTIKEKEYRQNFLDKHVNKGLIEYHSIDINYDGVLDTISGLGQPIIWLGAVFPVLPGNCAVYFGYRAGDDFWHYKFEFLQLVKYLSIINEKAVSVRFPLEWVTKADILGRLYNRYNTLDVFWTCENPKEIDGNIVACNMCTPCINLRLAIFDRVTSCGSSINIPEFVRALESPCKKFHIEIKEVQINAGEVLK